MTDLKISEVLVVLRFVEDDMVEVRIKSSGETIYMPRKLFPESMMELGNEYYYEEAKDDKGRVYQKITRSYKKYPIPEDIKELLK